MRVNELQTAIVAFNDRHRSMSSQGPFVGAVRDTVTSADELPPVLIVGINYGQVRTSTAGVDEEKLGYLTCVRRQFPKSEAVAEHHVVLWNFFPFLTSKPWGDLFTNRAEEAEQIFQHGYTDPIAEFEVLYRSLRPAMTVFHGVNNAVAALAHIAIRRVSGTAYLVDNLSRPQKCRAWAIR